MFVNTNQIQIGIVNYIEQEVATKAVGLQKFLTYLILPSIPKKIQSYVNALSGNDMFIDFFDTNGNVDLDLLYNSAKQAIQKSGSFEVAGIILNETDIDKIYSYIRNTI